MIFMTILSLIMALTLDTININGIAELPSGRQFLTLCLLLILIFFSCRKPILHTSLKVRCGNDRGGRALWSQGTNRSAGVAILINPKCTVEISDHKLDTVGRVLSVRFKHNN